MIIVMFNLSLFGFLAIVHRGLDPGSYNRHFSHDALNLHKLIDELSLKASRCHVVFAEVAFERNVIGFDLLREHLSCVSSLDACLQTAAFAVVFLHLLDLLIETVLEHLDGVYGVSLDVVRESGILIAHFVDVDLESLAFLADHALNPFLVFVSSHELVDCLCHLNFKQIWVHVSEVD